MAKKCDHTFLSLLNGTEQTQRFSLALSPEELKLNDISLEGWMEFAFNFAQEVNYFGIDNDLIPSGNWESFFIEKANIQDFVAGIEDDNSLTPHLTLFVCFLRLLEFSQSRFNKLTKKHLDFYYSEILKIDKKAPVMDSVHLIFELAKNAQPALISENTEVEAGKDASGKRMQYATQKEIVVNKAKVTQLKSIYHHRKTNNLNPNEYSEITTASVVNSLDGAGEAFKEDPVWLPFGYPSYFQDEFKLPTPKLGFAIAAPTLALAEGNRLISISYALNKNIGSLNIPDLIDAVEIYATGEEDWLGPFKATEYVSNLFRTNISGKKINFCIQLDKTEEAITAYNSEVHGGSYRTTQPLLRFVINTKQPTYAEGYKLYTQLLKKKVDKVSINVQVEEAESLQLQNDFGELLPNKPFFPFGTQPMNRSAFHLGYSEAFNKYWKNVSIEAQWLNTPNSFKDHYIAYRRDGNNLNLSQQLYVKTMYYGYNANTGNYTEPSGEIQAKNFTSGTSNLYVDSDAYFKAKLTIDDREVPHTINSALSLFTKSGDVFKTNVSINNNSYETVNNKTPLKLSLNQSFLHSLYPKVYALALTSEEDTLLPNEPYTPIVEKISLSYTAEQILDLKNMAETPDIETIQLFHEHPFGQSQNSDNMVPTYCKGGDLFIGLEDAQPQQIVNLLFQVFEGSENPLAESFTNTEKISWSILVDNSWQELDSTFLLGDSTDNFLKTGIVTISIPRETNNDNTLLPSGFIWLKANNPRNFDAVCKCIDVLAQVTTAAFINNENDLTHLQNGLAAGTISKLTQRDALIKKLTQPYASFGGSPEESDDGYYQRVSERIRHRDRAITLYDYEHLILEEFSEVYKVKCLNHTSGDNFQSAGNVNLVVIPDIVNQNSFDIFQPRLSTAKRNEIENYINQLNSFFITANVINPNYEEVEVTTGVKFRIGFDKNFYTSQLEMDIKKYLSPWAYKETSILNFGITFHKSKLIEYLEQLEYVDYLTDMVVKHRTSATGAYTEKVNVIPSNPKAILVSAKKHHVTPVESKCNTPTTNTPTVCLP